ncbi:DUF7093 family protein [Natronobeatus ordinarius]|uniref:DUF7093 family protein n=1 Tax=Natronobeatus ordinarius TaxID=2963433 RepID=UPI0020CE88FD|nr:hypothetical protein [Natronobeatus ordinarius]
MVLRCSLLGHDFGDTEVEREREEQGSEVVVTVREYQECARCGEVRVVSESTEVTSVSHESSAAPDDPAPTVESGDDDVTPAVVDADDDGEILADEAGDEAAVGAPESAVGDADGDDETEILGETVDTSAETTESPAQPVAGEHEDPITGEHEEPIANEHEEPIANEHEGPITDDGEILEADDEPRHDRARGEWPESDDVGPPVGIATEPSSWPEAESPESAELAADEPADDVEPVDDAVFVDADKRPVPEPAATDSGTGIASAQPAPEPGKSQSTDPVAAEYFCPRCSFVAPATHGSLRPGDICPECRRGYLGERDLE